MDYIGQLVRVIAGAANKKTSTQTVAAGRYTGGSILVNGKYYRPIWGGDFDAIDGSQVDCIVDGNKCVVVSVR